MSDEVETMFSADAEGRAPWHGKGVVVKEAQTSEQALQLAGLDWDVELWPTYAYGGPDTLTYVEVPGRYATVRSSDHAVLGDVGGRYKVRQNRELLSFGDALVDDPKGPNWHTAGALHGGSKIFATLGFPEGVTIAGTAPVDLWLVLAGSHDGSMASTAMITPVVVVCQNTLNLASLRAQGRWSFPHDSTGEALVQAARDSLNLSFAYIEEWEKEMEELTKIEQTKADFERLVRDVFPGKAVGAFTPEQYALIGVLESSPNIHDELRYTGWGALNAVREWDDWGKAYRGETDEDRADARLEAVWFGKNVKRSDDVYKYLTQAAA